jgi:2-polyprenyl-3-methyl-5-hydroxy-6-metoxy-1,4-benzoquinol methylase
MINKNFFIEIYNRRNKRRKILNNFKKSKIKKKDLTSYSKFGKSYFDNKKIGIGYGEYLYDGRFAKNTKKIINFFKLKKNCKILEIGCAKGFLLVEFFKSGMKTFGLDASSYAVDNAHILVKRNIKKFNIEKKMPFKNNFFDFVICKDVLPHIKKINLILLLEKSTELLKKVIIFL